MILNVSLFSREGFGFKGGCDCENISCPLHCFNGVKVRGSGLGCGEDMRFIVSSRVRSVYLKISYCR